MKRVACSLLVMLWVLLGVPAKAQVLSPSLEKELHSYLEVIHHNKGFSGELLVAQGHQILFREAIGWQSVELDIPAKFGANYRIASITKTFTGTLLAIAQQEGRLDPTDKAGTYIQELSNRFKDITIQQLVTHTSGLPHNEGIPNYWRDVSKRQWTTAQVIDMINQLDLLFEPGSLMHYSSLGYYLLATILERVYHQPFKEILSEKILSPLAMTESGIYNTQRIIPGMAAGYHLVTDDRMVVAPYRNYSTLKGAGDMHATTTDLLKWTNSFLNHTLITETMAATIFTPQNGYGWGWYIDQNEPAHYFHGGGTWGYSSFVALYPDTKISIILLSNVSTLPVSSMADDIEKLVYGMPFAMPTVQNALPSDDLNLNRFAGTYVSETSARKLLITHRQDRLFAQLVGHPAFEIYPRGDDHFFGKKVAITLRFEGHDREITGVSAERMGKTFHFKKL
jgi:CubicO group peptidase (beta-lactamase class C family)